MKGFSSSMAALAIGAPMLCFSAGPAARPLQEVRGLPGQQSRAQLISIPNARCDLHERGDLERSLEVFSNDEGVINLHVKIEFGRQAMDLVLDCASEDGTTDSRTVRLAPGSPGPLAERERAMRPALVGDPMHVTQKDLRRLGFPHRPDGASAEQMQLWIDGVSQRARLVSPRRVPGRARNAQTIRVRESNNWSGFMIEPRDGAKLRQVDGLWQVPRVTHVPRPDVWLSAAQYSSVWVGLDNGPGILQAGTQQNILNFRGSMISTYNAWIETYPAPLQVIPDFTVNPGDFVQVRVYSVNRNGEDDDKGEFMGFEITNFSPPLQSTAGDAFAKVAAFTGTTAEWVVERQTVIGPNGIGTQLLPLPDYGTVILRNAMAYDSTGRRHDLFTTTNLLHKFFMLDFNIVDEGAVTSAIQRTGRNSMKFTWINPAGGSE